LSAEAVLGTLHNTIIGGVGATINTKALLAAQFTAVSEGDISNFYLVGNDVYAQINKTYSIGPTFITTVGTSALTSYNDIGGNVTGLSNVWSNQTALTLVNFPRITTLSGVSMSGATALASINFERLRTLSCGAGQWTSFISTTFRLNNLETITSAIDTSFSSWQTVLSISLKSLRSIAVDRGAASGGQMFNNLNNCTSIYLPMLEKITYIGGGGFAFFNGTAGALTSFFAPNLKVLEGATTGFTALKHAGCVVTVHSDLATSNAGAENAIIAAIRAAGATIVYHQGKTQAAVATGAVINFSYPRAYNSPTSPETGNITDNLTGALIGIVQKIYHNHSTEPTVPAGWVLIGGEYVEDELNIIYAEWVSGTRVEYWIAQEI
jgi:hypothetical protein